MGLDELRLRAERFGVERGFWAAGEWVEPSEETLRGVLAAMRVGDDEWPRDEAWPALVSTRTGGSPHWRPPADAGVVLEDGSERGLWNGAIPADLPPGYHAVVGRDGGRTELVVAPPACYLPARLTEGGRAFGFALQLYALRSAASWGIGELPDLGAFAALEPRAAFTLINPLHAVRPTLPQEPSPYAPISRIFRNPLYLRLEDVPEARALEGAARDRFEALAAAGRALLDEPLVLRDEVHRLKREAFELCHSALSDERRARLDAYRAATHHLDAFATFCAIWEQQGAVWQEWPEELRHPDSPAVAAFAARNADAVERHAYVQLLVDEQLEALHHAGEVGVVNDLAIGVAPEGFDIWLWQDVYAQAATTGAPPDPLGPQGQNWGLPPLVPHLLRERGCAPFIDVIRANLRHAGGLRIDHVMGLGRLFWIPEGLETAAGAYVRYPFDDLVAILALESHRAKALVVGEDLGTIDPGVRDGLQHANVLSYRLAWFEHGEPSGYPRLALASVGTHDLPTIAGFFDGSDLQEMERAGAIPAGQEERFRDEQARTRGELLDVLRREGLLAGDGDDPEELTMALARFLGRTPSLLVAMSADDALGAVRRPNIPGTVETYPNWSIPLPEVFENGAGRARLRRLADVLSESVR
jgi:4-alpha-glucanotransferase